MLARLEAIPGVASAAVDHRGEFLRIHLDRGELLSVVHSALEELGYRGDDVSDEAVGAAPVRWYGAAGVGDLSREEAGVIAARVVPAVAREHGLDRAAGNELARAVADALYGCFTAHTLGPDAAPIALREACSRAVEAAAAPLIGADGARELVAALWGDLDTRSAEVDRDG